MSARFPIHIAPAEAEDVDAIADIHLAARREAMPYLTQRNGIEETRAWFEQTVGDPPELCWVARSSGLVVAYMALWGNHIDDLYVRPDWQCRGVGAALVDKAKLLSPFRLELRTLQRNLRARTFYERHGFAVAGFSPGDNEEGEPDVCYVWRSV